MKLKPPGTLPPLNRLADAMHPARQDFRKFVFLLWKHLNLPAPTDVQYDIARYLQTGPRRCVIEAFRGVGKSWLTAGFVVWLLWNDPQQKILVVSASKDRADQFSSFVKRIIAEMPLVQHLQPKRGQRDSMIAFDVGPSRADHSPSVKSVGVTGQLTGSRADVIIPDDVEVPNNSMTQTQRDQLAERVKEFDAILKPGGRFIYLGTPQCEASLYIELPERGYQVRVWPALYPTLKQIDGYKGTLAPFITRRLEKDLSLQGTTTDPKRFSDDDLMERRVSYGKAGFALQFMLDTTLADLDKHPLKLADLITMSLPPTMAPIKIAWAGASEQALAELPAVGLTGDRYNRPMWYAPELTEYAGAVMTIDNADGTHDETAFVVVKQLHGNLFLTLSDSVMGPSDASMGKIAQAAKSQGVNLIRVESNAQGNTFAELLRKALKAAGYPCTVETKRSHGQKELRIISTLEPVLGGHRLVVDARVIEQDYACTRDEPRKSLFYQLTRITRDRGSLGFDDRIDALAQAVSYWSEALSRDQEKAAEAHKDRAIHETLKDFIRNALGKGKRRGRAASAFSTNRGLSGR